MNFLKNTRLSDRAIFWIIILSSIIVVVVMFGSVEFYRSQEKQAKATLVAIPTMTAESLEFLYQKGLGYINIGQWQDAKAALQSIFEIDPNYKDVQDKLREVNSKMTELNLTPEVTPNALPTSVKSTVSMNGVIAYYPFNGNARDESGNQHDGNINGVTLVQDRFGNSESAYAFNGRSDYIHLNINADEFADDFTIAVWVKFNNFNNNYPQILTGENYFVAFHGLGPTYRGKRGHLTFYQQTGLDHSQATRIGAVTSVRPLDTNEWYFVVITRNELLHSMYIDARAEKQYTSDEDIPLTGSSLYIGANIPAGSSSGYLDGYIDDIRIFNYALTQQEIQSLYNENGWEGDQ